MFEKAGKYGLKCTKRYQKLIKEQRTTDNYFPITDNYSTTKTELLLYTVCNTYSKTYSTHYTLHRYGRREHKRVRDSKFVVLVYTVFDTK